MPSAEATYKTPSRSSITLDTACNAATYWVGQWTPDLKRNQSRDLLRLLVSMMWFPCHGNLFNGRIRASHAALADHLNLTREWTCTLVGRLREANYIETYAPRLPNGKQEITIFRIGKRFKRILVKLLKSLQRSRANTSPQPLPTKEEVAKNKAQFAKLIADVAKQMEARKPKRW